jgi:versiconal hemiacetal acetate esterase
MVAANSPPPDPSVDTRDDTVDGVSVRIYTPQGSSGKLPVGVYYHGGGYVVGNLDSEDAWCRYISKHTPCILVSADYRLGPKFKQPAMLDDCLTVAKWVRLLLEV